jgi:hypothetical protein
LDAVPGGSQERDIRRIGPRRGFLRAAICFGLLSEVLVESIG